MSIRELFQSLLKRHDSVHSPPARSLDLEWLEDRLMLSASPLAVAEAELAVEDLEAEAESIEEVTLADDPGGGHQEDHAIEDASALSVFEPDSGSPTASEDRLELVFVDSGASDFEALVDDLLRNEQPGTRFEVFVLDASTDGISQITDILRHFDSVDALHLVSHGTDGGFAAGDRWVNNENLAALHSDFAQWQDSVTFEADLLIYGCDLAATDAGHQLIQQISSLTGMDVSASIDATGHETLGGDWDLEFAVGSIESTVAFTSAFTAEWQHVLDATASGTNFQINDTTTDVQKNVDLIVQDDGSAIAVFDGLDDGDGEGVYLRLIDTSGNPTGADVRVNETTFNQQVDPAIARDSAGNFVVTWTSTQSGSMDIYARLFDSSGTAVTGEFLVNGDNTIGEQQDSAVGMDKHGNFVVVWEGQGTDASKGLDSSAIWSRRFDALGTATSDSFLVLDSATAFTEDNPDVAMSDDGEHVITWTYRGGGNPQIYGQRFDSDGSPAGQFLVQSAGVDGDDSSAVGIDSTGNFAVAWAAKNADASQSGIKLRRFSADGTPLSGDTLVNTHVTLDQYLPALAMDSDGDFIVTWTSVDQDGDAGGIYGQAFSSDGTTDGPELGPINDQTTLDQNVSAVAINDFGTFYTAWEGQSASDSSGLVAQRYSWSDSGTLIVDTTGDVLDGDTSSVSALLANKGADGFISLREAVIATNNTTGADTILLGSGTYRFTNSLQDEDLAAGGDLDVIDTLTIVGAGSASTTIDAGYLDRVLDVFSSDLTLVDLSVERGLVNLGAGLRADAGSTVTLSGVAFASNIATTTAGAISSAGAIIGTDSSFTSNSSSGDAGAIENSGDLSLTRTTFASNSASGDGGAIFNNSSMVLSEVSLHSNSAQSGGSGGGIFHGGTTGELDRVTLSNNDATQGGAICNKSANPLQLTNVTISGNTASEGAAIYTVSSVNVTNATIVANTASLSTGGIALQGGSAAATLKNTIIAGNTGGNTNTLVTSLGYNIDDGNTAFIATTGDQQNVTGVMSTLGSLHDNGGFTQTRALLSGNPAIDAGTSVGAPVTDQTGTARNGNTDIGAVEFIGPTGLAIWRDASSTTPQTSIWNGSSFEAEEPTLSVGNWRVIQGADSPTRDERIIVGVGDDGVIEGQFWNGSDWSNLPLNPLGTVSETHWWSVDVAYEEVSGDALVAWTDGSSIQYSTWDGATWSSSAAITGIATATPRQLRLEHSPDSDEIVLVVSDSNSHDFAIVWDGSSWENGITLHNASGDDGTDVNIAYESRSGDAFAFYGDNATSTKYRIWNGIAWSPEQSISAPAGITGNTQWTVTDSDPNSDRIALGVYTTNSEIWLAVWDGTSNWDVTEATSSAPSDEIFPHVAVAFESDSGQILAAYGDASASVNQVRYRTWNGSWSAEALGPNIGAQPNSITLTAAESEDGIMLAAQDSAQDLNLVYWNGLSWETPTELETSTGESKNQPFLFLWDDTSSFTSTEETIVTNAGLTIAEAGVEQITQAFLETTDNEAGPSALVYTVTTPTANGALLLDGAATTAFTQQQINAGRITYQHDGTETSTDSFQFSVDDGAGTASTGTFNIGITNTNDEQTIVANTQLDLSQGSAGTVSKAFLETTDEESPPNAIVYTVTTPTTNGAILLDGAATTTFTQAQINSGRVTYQHDASNTTTDSFDFSVNDDAGIPSTATFSISIQSTNQSPIDISPDVFNVDEAIDTTAGYSLGRLTTVDPDIGDSFTYTIVGGTDSSSFSIGGAGLDELIIQDGVLDHETKDTYSVTVRVTDSANKTYTVLDNFSATSYGNNDGTANWTAEWIEINDNTLPGSGNVRIEGGQLHLDNLDGGTFEAIQRSVDLSDATEATLTFDYGGWAEGPLGNDRFATSISNDGGASWTLIEEIVSPAPVAGAFLSGSVSYRLEDFVSLTADTVIRVGITSGFGGTTQHITLDNVQITYATSCYTETLSVLVTDINEAPTDITLDNSSVSENSPGADVGNVSVNDPDAGDTYSLSVDDPRFEVVAGQLSLKSGQSLNHEAEPNVTVTITATDQAGSGLSYGEAFVITVSDINDEEVLVNNNTLNVNEAQSAKITSDLLETTDAEAIPAAITYTVTNPTNNGAILLDGTPTTVFTQQQIDDGQVTYQHDGTETTTDKFDFKVDDGAGSDTGGQFQILITPVNDEQAITTNLTLNLDEGDIVKIKKDHLETTDSDTLPENLVYTVTTPTANGTLLVDGIASATFTQDDINSDELEYQHNSTDTTSDNFQFSVDDGLGVASTGTFNFSITTSNDEQTLITNAQLNLNEGATETITRSLLETTDEESLANAVTYAITSPTVHGVLLLDGSATTSVTQEHINTGRVTYQHDGTETTSDSFQFSVDDGAGAATTGTFSIGVTLLNDQPLVVQNNALSVIEGAVGTISKAMLEFTDEESPTPGTLTYTVTSSTANGTVLLDGAATTSFTQAQIDDGQVAYLHDGTETSSDSFDFSVSDSLGATASGTFTIAIANENDEQVIAVNSPANLTEGGTASITRLHLETTDEESLPESITYSITTNTAHGTVMRDGIASTSFTQQEINAGRISYQHDGSETTTDSFVFSVNDGAGAPSVATFSFAITPANDEQTLITNNPLILSEGDSQSIGRALLETLDTDNGPASINYLITTAPSHGSLLLNGLATTTFSQDEINSGRVTYRHDSSNQATDSFQFSVDDGAGTATTASFNIAINLTNDAPTVDTNTGLTVNEGLSGSITQLHLQTTDEEQLLPGGINYSVTTPTAHGTLLLDGAATTSFTQVQINSGRVSYLHDGSETSSDNFAFKVEDGMGGATSSTFSISILNTNDEQTLVTNDRLTVSEGLSGTISKAILETTDEESLPDAVVYTVTGAPVNGALLLDGSPALTFSQDAINSGRVSYEHNGSETSTDSFAFTVDDGSGTPSAAMFNIAIDNVNDAEQIITNAPLALLEGETRPISRLNLETTDEESLPSNLIYSVTAVPSNGQILLDGISTTTFTQQHINTGRVSYQHDGSETLTDRFEFEVNDGAGTASSGTFSIAITAQNDEQTVATNRPLSILRGDQETIDQSLLETTDEESLPNSIVYIVTTPVSHGSLLLDGAATSTFTQEQINAGRITYEHDGSGEANDGFDFTVDDGQGLTTAGRFSIVAATSQSPPVVQDDAYLLENETEFTIGDSDGVLSNDTIADGATATVRLLSEPQYGVVTLNSDGSFSYLADAGYFGNDQFQYVVEDSFGGSSTGTVTLVVGGGNDPLLRGQPPEDITPPELDQPEPSDTQLTIDPLIPQVLQPTSVSRDDFGFEQQSGDSGAVESPTLAIIVSPVTGSAGAAVPVTVVVADSDAGASPPPGPTAEPVSEVERDDSDIYEPRFDVASVWNDIDETQDELAAVDEIPQFDVGVAFSATTALTVGYVIWTLRGGWLIASLLSQAPAWRSIDPLVVLDHPALFKDDEEDDDSLQALILNSQHSTARTV